MDQIKIGKFIAECRKKEKLTQMQLAEKLNITDRAVSKWERGKAMPDSSIMLELCGVLGITVNDLLSGEVVTMENYNKEMENNLIEMVKEKEAADRRLLTIEIVLGIVCLIPFLRQCALYL
ncbi:MAG: helix-turn-helix transcriptional regulator [Ruminococcaceae bacterium]|nr:helix-turn-helix transcriptional regulator [Oscillospiraceae bacterium]